jgi:uncharacterized protein (TIGR02453 family)
MKRKLHDMKNALEYLFALERNNDREWYRANKKWYQEANAGFERLIEKLIVSIGKFDSAIRHGIPKELTFRLVRDTRFSNDKSPYNPAFRAHISSAGKLLVPVGYFIFMAPGDRSFLGGGLHASMFKDATTMIRDYIVDHGSEFDAIVKAGEFSSLFTVKGEALKNVPRGYDGKHPQAEYLKFKSWYLEYPVSDHLVSSDGFVDEATRIFLAMKPFNDYLNAALKGFQMPARKSG